MNKQIIIIRKDLKMRRGKEIAAGAHASLAVFLNMAKNQGGVSEQNCEVTYKFSSSNPAVIDWLSGHFRKITVTVDSEAEMLALHAAAEAAGLLTALIKDAGFTEFHGVHTYTALAIGPDTAEKIDPLTKNLKLY